MSIFTLLALQSSDGQLAQIAKTFGVDWTHLGAQIVSFSIVCALLYKFAYRQVLAMLEERRSQIALGLENADKIKAELDRTEALRQEVIARSVWVTRQPLSQGSIWGRHRHRHSGLRVNSVGASNRAPCGVATTQVIAIRRGRSIERPYERRSR